MAQKNYYYVGVMDRENGMMFVTKANYQDRHAEWDRKEKPLAMTQSAANDISQGLLANWTAACVIKTSFELDDQCCWARNEEQKNIDTLSSLVADVAKDVDDGVAKPWQIGIYCAAYNTDTFTISVHKSYGMSGIPFVRFVATERDKNGEFSAYEIQPTRRLWQVFRDTEENREDFVEQLENKTGKRFAFAEPTERKRDRQLMRSDSIENVNEPQRNEILELEPSNTPDYYELLDGEGADLDLTQGNGRSR